MTQLGAVLLDSLRLLRSRFLFKLTLGLSALAAVVLFTTYSFNEQGIRFLWMDTWENPLVRKGLPGARDFVAFMFNDVYVTYWLSWGAMILAIVSTASILPDFFSDGAVELVLSKPISRLRLLLYRALGALLFVVLQASVGVGLAYLIIGLKFDMWITGLLWAVPLLTLQFLYLYSFSALLAVTTRSTLACVIGTVLIWFVVFIVQFSSTQLDGIVENARSVARQNEERIDQVRARAAAEARELNWSDLAAVSRAEARVKDSEQDVRRWGPYARWLNAAELAVPKTGDLKRIVANRAQAPTGSDFLSLLAAGSRHMRPPNIDDEEWEEMRRAGRETELAIRDINVPLSIGSSLVCVALLLGASAVIFMRRDF